MKRTLRIGTWNIQGIATKREVFKEMERYDMDIIALTETKKKGKGTEEKDGYVHIYSGTEVYHKVPKYTIRYRSTIYTAVPKEERARGGVSLAIRKKYKKFIKSWDQINHRLLQVDVDVRNHSLVVIAAYAPTDEAPAAEKDTFFFDLTTALEKIGSRKEVILIGDLNGRTGFKLNDPVVGRYGEHIVNNNGERLIHLCEQALRIANGWFPHKDIHKYTWTQPTQNLKSLIDYIIVRQKTQLKISDVRVMRGPECGTDHFLVVAKSYFPYKQKMQSNGLPEKNGTPLSNVKYNIESLRNDSTKFLYQMRLATKLNRIGQGSPNDMYESLKTCIHEATNEALGEKIVSTRYRKDTPWWSEELGKRL
ncbi:craniofacial development protein 2-like [Sitophilus oryzae]|uniref:Craniofacial development protein 2-like n=1 Tax=Sitophilus oryzae TaxID=7048 RepID=A0A6J2XIU7_SITOR|nr:craniofacial development protein 2-like [Sitophilus oryzae]